MNEAATSKSQDSQDKRKFRNYFLQPLLQIKLGLYSIILTAVFSLTVAIILYLNLVDFAAIIFALTDSESEIRELFTEYVSHTRWWIFLLILGFLATNIAVSVIFTHKLVGPTIAFRNQLEMLRKGDFSREITLRKGDAFEEVAEEINLLTKQLAENNGKISDQSTAHS